MVPRGGSAVVPLGPLARRLLARRRHWLRWVAIALAALTILSAAAQLRHRPVVRRPRAPLGGVRPPAPAPQAGGGAPQLPAGMRIMNLVVPAAAVFGGRLPPFARVDLLAAFDAGPDRFVRRVVASGLVLYVSSQSRTAGSGAPAPFSGPDGRFAAAPVAGLSIAVPAAAEREIVMAQAFGRLFVALRPGSDETAAHGACGGCDRRVPGPPESGASLSMRRYLGLPASTPAPSPAPMPSGWLPAPPLPWAGLVPGPSRSWGATRGPARPPDIRRAGRNVEVIEDTTRRVTRVPVDAGEAP